jgi:hypothetical protein
MADATDENRDPSQDAKRKAGRSATRKRRRWRRLAAAAMILLVIWFLPVVVAKTPLFSWILKRATADLNGSVTVQSASLGWLSPIEVAGVEVKDAAGKRMLYVGAILGDRPLGKILFNYSKLGKFSLRGTELVVVLRDDGTNVEDVLAKYLVPKKEPSSSKIGLAIEIDKATASVVDQQTGLVWKIEIPNLAYDMREGPDGPISAAARLDLNGVDGPARVEAHVTMGAEGNTATASVRQFPLAMLRAVLSRIERGTTLTGRLSSEVSVAWGDNKPGKNDVTANLSVTGFSLATPLISSDVLRIDALQVGCLASLQADRLEIEKATADCDFGYASLSGAVPLGQKDGFSLRALLRQRQKFNGQIDLARLARLLPASIHLREQTRIDSGLVKWNLSSEPTSSGVAWHGEIGAANVTAVAQGQPIVWQQPIAAVFDAHQQSGTLVVDQLTCESDFLIVRAKGTTDSFSGELGFSLDRLGDRLGQLVKIDWKQFSGQCEGKFRWSRSPQKQFEAGAEMEISGFQWAAGGGRPWQEKAVLVNLAAKGQTDFDADTRIDSAQIGVAAGTDRLAARLSTPMQVKNLTAAGAWPIAVSAQGQLQNWSSRLAVWLPPDQWRLVGDFNLTADLAASQQGIGVRQARLALAPLVVMSAGLNVNEPNVVLAVQGDYDFSSQTLQLTRCELTSSMLTAAVGGKIAVADGKRTASLDGQVNYDLERLGAVLLSSFGSKVRLAGRGTSSVWYRGPLALETGSAAAAFRCGGAAIYGFPVGPADVKANMANGVVQIEPIDAAVGQGRIHLAPQMRVAPGRAELRLPRGPVVQNVQVSPEMCESLLQYIAPALAGVKAVQGTFSIDLDECCVPLDDPKQADVSGRLTIHSMTVGSGPLLQELAVFQTRASGAQLQSVVAFHMTKGRVEYNNLVLAFPEITIRSHGSIGLDQTVNMVAEMPVPSKWLGGNAVAIRAAQGQVIAIPLRGPLAKPALDQKVLQEHLRRFVKNAAINVIEGGLNELLKPKK